MDKTIIVIGDISIERYILGPVTGLVPDNGCPLMEISSVTDAPGDAANLALSLAGLGNNVHLITILSGDSEDPATTTLKAILADNPKITLHAYHLKKYKPPLRTTVVDNYFKKIVRFDDTDTPNEINLEKISDIIKTTFNKLFDTLPSVDAIVIADYDGIAFLMKETIDTIVDVANTNNVLTVVIPSDNLDRYSGVNIVVADNNIYPGYYPLELTHNEDNTYTQTIPDYIHDYLHNSEIDHLVITSPFDGILLLNTDKLSNVPLYLPKHIINTATFNNTAAATLIDFITTNKEEPLDDVMPRAVIQASVGAGLSLSKTTEGIIYDWELAAACAEKGFIPPLKQSDLNDASIIITDARQRGERVVFTDGCFNTLDVNTVNLLTKARSFGDILVVGLYSDEMIRKQYIDMYPIVPIEHRIRLLESLSCVEIILTVNSPEEIDLILNALLPEVFVKPETFKTVAQNTIRGADIVTNHGGCLKYISV